MRSAEGQKEIVVEGELEGVEIKSPLSLDNTKVLFCHQDSYDTERDRGKSRERSKMNCNGTWGLKRDAKHT